ncbi:MAG: hypothetical protein RSE58_08280 [Clostridia bacterium]
MASYSQYLCEEVMSARYALIIAYEKKDHLMYVEAPPLRREYQKRMGDFEERVLKAELENALLEHKKTLIQTALNRRQPIDPEKLASELEAFRQQLLQTADAGMLGLEEGPVLSAEETKEMSVLYQHIIATYHPAIHPNLMETQKILFLKALDAYQRQNLDAMRLVYAMLFDDPTSVLTLELLQRSAMSDVKKETQAVADALTTDYTLAHKIWDCFEPLEGEQLLVGVLQKFLAQMSAVSDQLESLMASFPFTAVDMLQNPELEKKYRAELEARLYVSESKRAVLEEQIEQMMAEAVRYA